MSTQPLIYLRRPPDWEEHEKPSLPGSPGMIAHPSWMRVCYALVAVLVGITGGLGNALFVANLPIIQAQAQLDGIVRREANVLAYNDVFWVVALVASAYLLWSLLQLGQTRLAAAKAARRAIETPNAVGTDGAAGNFTKVVQRLPVKIRITPGQPQAQRLRPGMSVIAHIDTAPHAPLP